MSPEPAERQIAHTIEVDDSSQDDSLIGYNPDLFN